MNDPLRNEFPGARLRFHSDTSVSECAMRGAAGFTLIELMVVIVILGVLAGLIVPQFMNEPQKARVVKAQMQIESLSTALKKFYIDNGFYPTTEQGLDALVKPPATGRSVNSFPDSGYIKKIPEDPWGNKYVYVSPGEHDEFDIICLGADGAAGGTGNDADINSWQIE